MQGPSNADKDYILSFLLLVGPFSQGKLCLASFLGLFYYIPFVA
jgi:hypothetical protein